MKYIDADRLQKEIERQIMGIIKKQDANPDIPKHRWYLYEGMKEAFNDIGGFIDSLQQEQPIKVYRVENEKEQKGLWRKFDGTWEPLFDMLTDGQCKDMPMEDNPVYREGGKQWFASAPSRETLRKWFSKRDLEELTEKDFTISEFEVVGYKKISDFEYIFTRDNIISRKYLKVSDIYPQEQPEVDLDELINDFLLNNSEFLVERDSKDVVQKLARHFYELGLNARKED